MSLSKRWMGLSALALSAGLGLTMSAANAATVSFNAEAFSLDGRSLVGSYVGSPVGSVPPGVPDHEAIQVSYTTSGLPYVISKIVYTAAAGVTFDEGSGTAMQTRGAGFSIDPVNGAPPSGNTPATGATTTFTQDFYVGTMTDGSDSDFQQGAGNQEVTYLRMMTGAGELGGTTTGPVDLLPFNGSMVEITFTRLDPTRLDLPASFKLSASFGVQTTPFADPKTLNYANTGGNRDFADVPEPGSVAMFLGAGVVGTSVLLRRRRR